MKHYFFFFFSVFILISCKDSKPDSVFTDSDFELCNLPLPEGYPNSWTHVGIEYVKDGFCGYKYFLTCTPYPEYNDDYENPMFFYANERSGCRPPIDFIPYNLNPLQDDPGDGYNADPDVIFIDSVIYVINRPYIRPDSVWVNCQKCKAINSNFIFDSPYTLYSNKQHPYNFGFDSIYKTSLISPSIVKYNDEYRIYHLATNSYNDNSECKGVVIMKSDSIEQSDGFAFLQKGSIQKFDAKPWHFDLFQYDNKLYAIVCAYVHEEPSILTKIPIVARFVPWPVRKCYQYLAVSEDGINFKVYDKPLTTINSYRSSAFVREDGMFVLYISTLDYKPQGNKSIDGRNIMVAYKPFVDVLFELNN